VELAQMFARLGSRVTIVARSALLRGYEPPLGETLGGAFESEGIELVGNARVERVSSYGGAVARRGRDAEGRPDHSGRAAPRRDGRTPNTTDLGLAAAGVATDDHGFITVDAGLRTNQPHVWAAGDIIGRQHGSQMATPVGARQGRLVAENAFADAGR
jgi:mercuric reductase